MIPASFIQDLLSRVDVADIVGRHVTLKKAGINYKGLCPFHGEKSPSFIVSPSRQTYHCFGCGAHGDAIRFLVEHAGLGFVEAVQELASEVGLQVPSDERSPAERERAQVVREGQRQISDVLGQASLHYRQQLKKTPRAIDYLKRRGLTGQIAAQFGLGYAPAGWHGLASAFPNYDDPLLEEAGLVIAATSDGADRPNKRYDRFRDRIMFPIRSVKGEVLGFGARILDQGEPKYLNSPETPVFVKGRELYGLFEARTALRQAGFALVTEGYMDVVALAQHGIANAVATLGTACTADHVQKLLRFTDRVVFAFDGDNAGRRAAARALEAALPHATDTRSFSFLFLPADQDPDSYVREVGAAGFSQAVTQSIPLSKQLVELAAQGCGDLNSAEERARMLAQARVLWTALPDGVLKLQVLEALAAHGGVPAADLKQRWGSAPPSRASAPSTHPAVAEPAGEHAAKPQRATTTVGAATTRSGPWKKKRFGAYAADDAPSVYDMVKAAPRQAPPSLLDRALWLLLHQPALWNGLSTDSQHRLAEQAAPYGPTFTWVEREAQQATDLSVGGEEDDRLLPDVCRGLVARIRRLLPPEAADNLQLELESLLRRLELQEVESELKMLFESGSELPADCQARGRYLLQRQTELKRMAS